MDSSVQQLAEGIENIDTNREVEYMPEIHCKILGAKKKELVEYLATVKTKRRI
jgi:hypothetical protein